MRVIPALVFAAILAVAACSAPNPGPAPTPSNDAGTSDDAGSDGGLSDSGYPYDLPTIDYVVDAGDAITAPNETWTFAPVEDAHCANGTSTGVAVNLTDKSDRVLILLAGGGACWEAAACAAGTATHITDTMGEAAVLGEAQSANYQSLFDRTNPDNPFKDASFVYVPYCTGDLHAGTKPHAYDWFGPKVVEHVGARNIDAYLRRLQPTFPNADRIYFAGVSAGGYGATLNWWRVQKAFPWARVDVFNDSGLIIDTAGDGRYGTMQAAWTMEFPPGCTDCTTSLGAALPYSAQLLTAPRKYAMLGFRQDNVIGTYFGLSGTDVQTRVDAVRANAAPNVKTFLVDGTDHVVLGKPSLTTSDGGVPMEWIQQAVEDAPGWDHAGP